MKKFIFDASIFKNKIYNNFTRKYKIIKKFFKLVKIFVDLQREIIA